MPEQRDLSQAAEFLRKTIRLECDRLAVDLVHRLDSRIGPIPPRGVKPPTSEARIVLELTKLRIRRLANVELERAVASAREAGATWADVGWACNISRQAAYDRWAKVVRHISNPPDVLPAADPLEKYNLGERDPNQPGTGRLRKRRS